MLSGFMSRSQLRLPNSGSQQVGNGQLDGFFQGQGLRCEKCRGTWQRFPLQADSSSSGQAFCLSSRIAGQREADKMSKRQVSKQWPVGLKLLDITRGPKLEYQYQVVF